MVLKPITDYGWSLKNDLLQITWDTEDNMTKVRERVSALLKGCKCTTGCKSRVCGCRKKQTLCSEGCQCTNCGNLKSQSPHHNQGQCQEDLEITLEEAMNSSGVMDSEDEEEFADFVFAAAYDDSDGTDS